MPDAVKETIKAAKKCDLARLKELLIGDPKLINARDVDGSTPLHCAVWKGHLPVVTLLIDAGANVNAINRNDHWGTTPLHAAAHANQPKIAEVLLQNGADVNAKDLNGNIPMFHTTYHKAKAAAKVIEQFQNNG